MISSALKRHLPAETMHRINCLGMYKLCNMRPHRPHLTVSYHINPVAFVDAKTRGNAFIYPKAVFRQELVQIGVIYGVTVGMNRASAKDQAKTSLWRLLRRLVGLKGRYTETFEGLVYKLYLAGRSLEFPFRSSLSYRIGVSVRETKPLSWKSSIL